MDHCRGWGWAGLKPSARQSGAGLCSTRDRGRHDKVHMLHVDVVGWGGGGTPVGVWQRGIDMVRITAIEVASWS